jgi:predicted mannosyl-3-phosphoglycerate phosphatase (HAD superfamily)
LRPSNTVVFCAIDDLIPIFGSPLSGFVGFLEGLASAGIPSVWVTSRNRHQLDTPIRKLGHPGPFIAEGGSGTYLPQDYFHLKPAHTVRLGRFTCVPKAAAQPAAAEALDALAGETGVSVVPLRSLSPRELMQNTGLPRHEADVLRQRDFDEFFFFAGASDPDIQEFRHTARHHKYAVRSAGVLWSLAIHADLAACVQDLRKLYDRACHAHSFAVALATPETPELVKACDRAILLTDRASSEPQLHASGRPAPTPLPLFSPSTWPTALEAIQNRRF